MLRKLYATATRAECLNPQAAYPRPPLASGALKERANRLVPGEPPSPEPMSMAAARCRLGDGETQILARWPSQATTATWELASVGMDSSRRSTGRSGPDHQGRRQADGTGKQPPPPSGAREVAGWVLVLQQYRSSRRRLSIGPRDYNGVLRHRACGGQGCPPGEEGHGAEGEGRQLQG